MLNNDIQMKSKNCGKPVFPHRGARLINSFLWDKQEFVYPIDVVVIGHKITPLKIFMWQLIMSLARAEGFFIEFLPWQ